MFFENINFIAVVIAAVVGMGIGFIWYSPWTFGPLWMRSKGWTDEMLVAKKAQQKMWAVYLVQTVGYALTAYALAVLFNSLVVTSFLGMALVALVPWLGFSVPTKLGDYLFGGDSLVYMLISVGQTLVSAVVMAVIVGLFG